MNGESMTPQLIRMLYRKGADEELIVGIVTILETEENIQAMMDELSKTENPTRTWLITKALLIAEPEDN